MTAEHQRHKPLSELNRPRELVLVCPELKSNVNLARMVRLAGCVAVEKLIAAGAGKIDPKIARDGIESVTIERRRSLVPVLKKLKESGYCIVGLEQTNESKRLFDYSFARKTALLIGHERHGIPQDQIQLADDLVEIPVWGMPFSYNVVTATTMAVYEYCRQFPSG